MAMLRSLTARGQSPDIVHLHSAPTAEDVIFHDELRNLEVSQPGYRLHLQLTKQDGDFDFDDLDDLVPDWRDRPTWACGPTPMLDTVESLWDAAGRSDDLHMERFTIARTDKGGEGGTVTFAISDKTIEIDGATSLLEAGEQLGIQMPFGCRMGICPTCVLPGRRLRQGLPIRRRTRSGGPNQHVRVHRVRRLHPENLRRKTLWLSLTSRSTRTSRPRTSTRSRGSWTRSGPTSKSHEVSVTPATSAGRFSCSVRWRSADELSCSRAATRWRGASVRRCWAPPRSSRTWSWATTSFTVSGTG